MKILTQQPDRILIIDDDESVCQTLSTIFRSQGYLTTIVKTAKAAIEEAKLAYYNMALVDVKLPDITGTDLLASLQKISPNTIKIIVTGYPSIQNAIEALNLGADSYIVKPIAPKKLLEITAEKLRRQKQKLNEEGTLTELLKLQIAEKQSSNFQETLQENAEELAIYGLTKTQAKIYISLIALGVASASEIANLSKIRREEIYRSLPALEKRGLVTRKLRSPKRYSATPPEKTIQILTKAKLATMKKEIDELKQKEDNVLFKLKAIEHPLQQENPSTEVIPSKESTLMKLIEMTQNAKKQIDVVTSLEELKTAYMNRSKPLQERLLQKVKIRAITETQDIDSLTEKIAKTSKKYKNPIKLRQTKKPPFNLIIVDDIEAMWGEFQPEDEDATTYYWTNDPVQIGILRTSFEKLWQDSTPIGFFI